MRRSWLLPLIVAFLLPAVLALARRPHAEPGLTSLQAIASDAAAAQAVALESSLGRAVAGNLAAEPPTVLTPDPERDRSDWPVIVAFGDSLTAGLGVEPDRNYPSQLQALLDQAGYRYRVVNAGISGELTAGGLLRVETVLEHQPQIIILELGANDGMQAVPVAEVRANLAGIIEHVQAAGAQAVLAGMMAPPNYGEEYQQAFAQIYPDLAAAYDLPLIPFFLEGVAGSPYLNQRDGIHPTPEGYAIVVRNVLATLEPLLQP